MGKKAIEQSILHRKRKKVSSSSNHISRLISHWPVKSLNSPLLSYIAAILIGIVTMIITMLLVRIFPSFAYPGALNILGILIIALAWGAGPSLLTTLLETLLLNLVLLSPQFSWSFYSPTHWVDTATFLVIGLLISIIASRIEQSRDEAILARQRLQECLDALLTMAEVLVQSPSEENATQQDTLDRGEQGVSQLAMLIRQVLGCERVGILRIAEETNALQPIALTGALTEGQQEGFSQLARFHLDDYLAPDMREGLQAGEIIINTHSEQTATAAMTNEFNPTMIVPLRVGSPLLGLLLLDCDDKGLCLSTPAESVLVGAVSKLASLMIERERLLRERTEAQANEMAAREATHKMDTFLAIASHELKTPLTVIKGNLQLMMWQVQESLKPPERRAYKHEEVAPFLEMLVDIGQQVDRLVRLVNDLLEVSRSRTDRLEMRMDVCNLETIVRKSVEEQRAVAPKRTIQFKEGSSAPVLVYADADRIGQVISNYLANALKYSPPDQPIEVGIEQDDHLVRVLVRDHGPGLAPDQREQVWERFRRLEEVKVLSGSSIGLGLGLYISKMIIEGHRGKVGVESLPGEGSTFWFALPIIKLDEEEDDSSSSSSSSIMYF